MWNTNFLNKVYTLNSSLDVYLLFENCTTCNYKIPYTGEWGKLSHQVSWATPLNLTQKNAPRGRYVSRETII